MTAVTNATYSTYTYTNDLLGRRTSKNDEQYGYNIRDELIAADEVSYAYDDIGNRTTAEGKTYTANNLNQYTVIDDFVPQYDADGNQTLIKTETGIWSVIYNAENRPIRWQSGDTVITMAFDRMVVTSSSVRTETWPKHSSLPLGSPPQKILRGYASLFLSRSASVTPYSSPPSSSTATIESSLKTGFFKNDYLTVHFCITLASIVLFKK